MADWPDLAAVEALVAVADHGSLAAAARATTAEEREAALAEVTADGDEPINRGLLLKFLSSVQT